MCERCEEIQKIKDANASQPSIAGSSLNETSQVYAGEWKERNGGIHHFGSIQARVGETVPWHQYAAGQNVASTQYTPMLVQMMFEIYQYSHMRSHYLYSGTLEKPQQDVMELLKRAEIVVPKEAPTVAGAAPLWEVDEDALRAYVNAVCNVSLPTKTWVMR